MATTSKYRNVFGGLDNAARQAEQRGLHDQFIVDADCHIDEPFTWFPRYMSDKWRKKYRKFQVSRPSEEHELGYVADPNAFVDPAQQEMMNLYKELRLLSPWDRTIGHRVRRPEIRIEDDEPLAFYEQKAEEIVDIFTTRMNDIGIKRSILFPNQLLELPNQPDGELEIEVSNAFIDYMLDKFLGKYPELYTCIYIPSTSPEKGAELIDRVGSEKGIAGILISPTRPGPLSGEEYWNAVYEAASQKGLPVCFHAEAYAYPLLDRFNKDKYLPIHALSFPFPIITQLTSIVCSGIPERFPSLRFVFIEAGVTWIPWIMYRLDSEYLMRKAEAPLLKKFPSEYIKEFYFTSQPLERPRNRGDLEWVFRAFGAETQLMYASDYPHWDFDLPSVIHDIPFLSKEAKQKILGGTARKLFKIN
ncbi:MAG: amidohydrolase family protein [Nitrososphaerales archaeon]